MLLVFGDSYSQDEGIEKNQQWFKHLSKLLYNDSLKCKSYARGGASNTSIVKQIYSHIYNHPDVRHIVINLTYLHRFRFYGNDYQPSMDSNIADVMYNRLTKDGHKIDKNIVETFAHSFLLINDVIKHTEYGDLLVTLNGFLNWVTQQKVKVLIFDVDGSHRNWWLNEKFYCKEKRIQNYLRRYNNIDNSDVYSNHITLNENLMFANDLYNEFKKMSYE